MLAENRFRTDLFYRLNVITLQIPPLRERQEDILPIARHLLQQIGQDCGLAEVFLSSEAEDALRSYAWPGNVRELSNVLERAVHYAEHDRVDLSDLPRYLLQKGKRPGTPAPEPLKHVQHSAEKEALRRALEAAEFNKARAAQMLGIHRSLFYKKLKKYGLSLRPPAVARRSPL
jgi:transcriptional regulator with PAS, ATPase and Fis domain